MFQQERDLRFSTDQGCESSGLSHIKAIGGAALAQDTIHGDRLRNTSECLFAQVLAGKIALDQAISRTTDHKRIGRSQRLDSSSDIGSLAQGKLLLSSTTS